MPTVNSLLSILPMECNIQIEGLWYEFPRDVKYVLDFFGKDIVIYLSSRAKNQFIIKTVQKKR